MGQKGFSAVGALFSDKLLGTVAKEPEFFSESQGHAKRFESYEDL